MDISILYGLIAEAAMEASYDPISHLGFQVGTFWKISDVAAAEALRIRLAYR